MKWSNSARPHVCAMLQEQKAELDRIFGAGTYSIEKTSDYSSILKTNVAEFKFTDDPRDFIAASVMAVRGVNVSQSGINTWVQFLGEDPPPQRRSDPYQKQLANELHLIALVVDQILKDEATTRDAGWFVTGYNRAYNDWASGRGSWTVTNFEE